MDIQGRFFALVTGLALLGASVLGSALARRMVTLQHGMYLIGTV